MKIFKKDSTKPVKQNPTEDSVTDISASTPKTTQPKEKMEEIYSTKDKHVKYKRQTPLEAEAEAKRTKEAKEKLASGKAEIALPEEEQKQLVELSPEFDESATIAEDIIEHVDGFSKSDHHTLHDIDSIDINLDPITAIKRYELQVNSKDRQLKRQQSTNKSADSNDIFDRYNTDTYTQKIVEKIPKYQHSSKVQQLHLKAGKFSEVVESEYNEYLKSHDPTISKRPSSQAKDIPENKSLIYSLSQIAQKKAVQKQSKQPERKQLPDNVKPVSSDKNPTKRKPKKKSKLKKLAKILSSMLGIKLVRKPVTDTKQAISVEDYQDRADSKHVSSQISSHFKKLTQKIVFLAILFATTLFLSGMESGGGDNVFESSTGFALTFCAINLLALLITGFICKSFIISGVKPLRQFKSNSDTAVSVAFFICLIQNVVALFYPSKFVGGEMHLYTPLVILAFALNCVGRLLMVSRVKENFKFLTSKTPAFAAKIFKDEDTARKMLSGTAAPHSIIAYQHPTDFLSDFLKISYAPDTSEESTSKLAPVTLLCSVFVSIIYAIISKSFLGLLCALAVMCCISIPISALLCGNIPLKLFCMDSLEKGTMISGYPSVKQFCDSNAIILSAGDLYPKGSIKLKDVHDFTEYGIDDNMLLAACILKEADNPMYHLFDDLLKENAHNLPKVESVLYEDKLGLVGWASGQRILIGNRRLMDRFHIYIDKDVDETKFTNHSENVTFVACAGQLVSMLVTAYQPNETIKHELQKAELNGLCFIVSTTDCNVTTDQLTNDYELFYRSIKVLSTGYSNVCTHYRTQKEETSRAYLATRGKTASFIRAITGCIKLRNNLTMGNVIQIFGLILGVLLCATMVLYANVSILGVFEILLYMLFWAAASIIAQLVKRP